MYVKIFLHSQINTKYLSPLFLTYDDRLEEREKIIKRYQVIFFIYEFNFLLNAVSYTCKC